MIRYGVTWLSVFGVILLVVIPDIFGLEDKSALSEPMAFVTPDHDNNSVLLVAKNFGFHDLERVVKTSHLELSRNLLAETYYISDNNNSGEISVVYLDGAFSEELSLQLHAVIMVERLSNQITSMPDTLSKKVSKRSAMLTESIDMLDLLVRTSADK